MTHSDHAARGGARACWTTVTECSDSRPAVGSRRRIRCDDCGACSTGPGWSWLALDVPGCDGDRGVAIVCRPCADRRLALPEAPL
jgi:hypothetical protein